MDLALFQFSFKDVSKKLGRILDNVNRAYEYYRKDDGIDPEIEKAYFLTASWEEKSRRSRFLDELTDVLQDSKFKIQDLEKVLESFKSWSVMLGNVELEEKAIPTEDSIDEMRECLTKSINSIEANVLHLLKTCRPVFEGKAKLRRKSAPKAGLFKIWREKVADNPQEGEPLTPEKMLENEPLAFTRNQEVTNLIQELVDSSVLSKAESVVIRYIVAMVVSLSKAFSLLTRQCRSLKIKCDNLAALETKKQDPQIKQLQRELRLTMGKKTALEVQIQNAEEQCKALLTTNEILQKELQDVREREQVTQVPIRPPFSRSFSEKDVVKPQVDVSRKKGERPFPKLPAEQKAISPAKSEDKLPRKKSEDRAISEQQKRAEDSDNQKLQAIMAEVKISQSHPTLRAQDSRIKMDTKARERSPEQRTAQMSPDKLERQLSGKLERQLSGKDLTRKKSLKEVVTDDTIKQVSTSIETEPAQGSPVEKAHELADKLRAAQDARWESKLAVKKVIQKSILKSTERPKEELSGQPPEESLIASLPDMSSEVEQSSKKSTEDAPLPRQDPEPPREELPVPSEEPVKRAQSPSTQGRGSRSGSRGSLKFSAQKIVQAVQAQKFVQVVQEKKGVKFQGDKTARRPSTVSDTRAMQDASPPQQPILERAEDTATMKQDVGEMQARKLSLGKSKESGKKKEMKDPSRKPTGVLQAEDTRDVIRSLGTTLQTITRERGGVLDAETIKDIFEELNVAYQDTIAGEMVGSLTGDAVITRVFAAAKKSLMPPEVKQESEKDAVVEEPSGSMMDVVVEEPSGSMTDVAEKPSGSMTYVVVEEPSGSMTDVAEKPSGSMTDVVVEEPSGSMTDVAEKPSGSMRDVVVEEPSGSMTDVAEKPSGSMRDVVVEEPSGSMTDVVGKPYGSMRDVVAEDPSGSMMDVVVEESSGSMRDVFAEEPPRQDVGFALQEFQEAILACLEDKMEKVRKRSSVSLMQPLILQPTDPQAKQLYQAIDEKLEECFSSMKQRYSGDQKGKKLFQSIQSKGELPGEEEKEIKGIASSSFDTLSELPQEFTGSSVRLSQEWKQPMTSGDLFHLSSSSKQQISEHQNEEEWKVQEKPQFQQEGVSQQDELMLQEEKEDLAKVALHGHKEKEQILEHLPDEADQQVKESWLDEKRQKMRRLSEEQQKHFQKGEELQQVETPLEEVQMPTSQEVDKGEGAWHKQLQERLRWEQERLQEEQVRLQEERQRLQEEQEYLEHMQELFEVQQKQWEGQQQQRKEQERLWEVQLEHWKNLQKEHDKQEQYLWEQREQQKEQQQRLQEKVQQLKQQYQEELKRKGEQVEEQWHWERLQAWHEQQLHIWQQEDEEQQQKRSQWQQQLVEHKAQMAALQQEYLEQELHQKRGQQKWQEARQEQEHLWEKSWLQQLNRWQRQLQRQQVQQRKWQEQQHKLQEKQRQIQKEEKALPHKLTMLRDTVLDQIVKQIPLYQYKAFPKEGQPPGPPQLTPMPSSEYEDSFDLESPWFPKPVPKAETFPAPDVTEKRYLIDVAAQRRNLELLREAVQKAELSSEQYTIAKGIIQEALRSNVERLAMLFRKYTAFYHLQAVRRNVTAQLDVAKDCKDGVKTQILYKIIDKLDAHQKMVLGRWTIKQNAVDKKHRHCLAKMMALFAQLHLSTKLQLSSPIPLMIKAADSTKKEGLPMPHIGAALLKHKIYPSPLVSVKKPQDTTLSARIRESSNEQIESLWKTDITALSIAIGPKTPVSLMWSEAYGFPDIPRFLELDISSVRKKPLQNIKTRIQHIPRWKISGYNIMNL
ncbi:protein FAM186A isoform X2 [Hemicordylus capensis]|uniref:protein FAM186A isoform X2 n=1 Tax=Hemicordylus capensis TaxID=884348 RepID=UPI00230231D8|nr:protein FAM186A isoform X2 [Hemicordylus capensis]